MGNIEFIAHAQRLVAKKVRELTGEKLSPNDIYVVFLAKVLQNNKATLSTDIPDGRYYEVTFNGVAREFYVDAYTKEENTCVKLEEV